jgi:carboxymethylenebutenolidase
MDSAKSLKRTSDFPEEVLSLFDKYVHNIIGRREFLDGAAKFAVGGVTAEALLEALSPRFAEAQQVPKTDARIKADYVEFPSPNGYGKGCAAAVGRVSRRRGQGARALLEIGSE